MFLSILDLESDCIHIPVAFKFHYDSINSASNEELHGSHRSSLNSIMFLLIRELSTCSSGNCERFKFHYVSINSSSNQTIPIYPNSFKFHYVSINSTIGLHFSTWSDKFKFHYVSINSFPICNIKFITKCI